MYLLKNDKSVEYTNGKVLYFSVERFISDIIEGDCCFICGTRPNQVEFNNEHILPKWILKKYNLFHRKIGLPNLTEYRYDRYTISCCAECNSLMNTKIEQPIKNIIEKGYNEVVTYIKNEGPWLFFIWLSLIYIKTHLKDKLLKYDYKSEVDATMIADQYDWISFHHIHCVARSFSTNPEISKNVMGSLLVLPSKTSKHYESYDYRDLYYAKTMFIQLGEITFIAVLNDSCASLSFVSEFVSKINGYVSPLQIRELLARLGYANIKLKNRPEFYSDINLQSEKISINAKAPEYVELDEPDDIEFGSLMYGCCKDILSATTSISEASDIELVKKGIYTFILDKNKNFIKDSMDILSNANE